MSEIDALTDEETVATEEPAQEDTLVDLLTGSERRNTPKEEVVQRMIEVLAGEYRYPLERIGRDIAVQTVYTEGAKQRKRRRVADLAAFAPGAEHEAPHAERVVVVAPPATKPSDLGKGVRYLEDVLDAIDACEFGLWTNGRDVVYLRKTVGAIEPTFEELSDFPGNGERLDDLDRPDRRVARVAVAADLRETVLRCHDYLYGNQAMTATRAFGELVKLIFCKIHDERELRSKSERRRRFWVGVTERNTPAGQAAIAKRIRELFAEVKAADAMRDVFRAADEIELEPKHLAWIATELARYNFLDAEVDVKGMAYEAMVATTMKRERGQFFTPRNVVDVRLMNSESQSILIPLSIIQSTWRKHEAHAHQDQESALY